MPKRKLRLGRRSVDGGGGFGGIKQPTGATSDIDKIRALPNHTNSSGCVPSSAAGGQAGETRRGNDSDALSLVTTEALERDDTAYT